MIVGLRERQEMLRSLFLLVILIPIEALADPLRAETRPCRVERQDRAYSNCVDNIAEMKLVGMDEKIGQVLSGLQAPTQAELTALQAQYNRSQKVWLSRVKAACAAAFIEDIRGVADCRLAAVLEREGQVSLSLSRLSDDQGGAVHLNIPVPEAVEVLVPLPASPNGPEQRIRVPLTNPVTPQ
jgi:hypothetical protein